MHRRTLISVAVIAAAGLSVNVARADAPSAAAEVTVGLSTALQAKREEIGQRDLDELRADLTDTVTRALARHQGGVLHITKVSLVIEDAKANRPTFNAIKRIERQHPVEVVGKRLRGLMTWIDAKTV